jgi:hypothetical protein
MKMAQLKGFALALLLVLPTGAVATAQATNFVTNPTFAPTDSSFLSSGTNYLYADSAGDIDVPGWTFSPLQNGVSGSGITGPGGGFGFTTPTSGAPQVGFLQITATVSQSITGLTPGDSYDLTFNLEGRPSTGAPLTTVTIGGVTVLSGVIPPNNSWTSYNDIFEAIATSETLTFSTIQRADTTTGIDDPSITFVPEGGASLLYLLLAGAASFGSMILSLRYRLGSFASA